MCLCETIGCIIGNFCLSYCDIDTIMITINRVQVSKMAIIKILTWCMMMVFGCTNTFTMVNQDLSTLTFSVRKPKWLH